jgi:hypothetical protein
MLHDVPVHVRLKLSALWTSVVFCYVYGDIFGLFRPGKLASMISGQTPVGPTTQALLIAFAIVMAIPSVMVFVSVALKASLARRANVLFGSVYAIVISLTMRGAWGYYLVLGVIEVALTVLIAWYAWTWPAIESPLGDVSSA